jgi:hypothetical protein
VRSPLAIRWFNPDLRIFPEDALEAAFDHLEATGGERTTIRAALDLVERIDRTNPARNAGQPSRALHGPHHRDLRANLLAALRRSRAAAQPK